MGLLEKYTYTKTIGQSRWIDPTYYPTSDYTAVVYDKRTPIAKIGGTVFPTEQATIYLHHLKVDSNYRYQQIGVILLSDFITWAKTTPALKILLSICVDDTENPLKVQEWFIRKFRFQNIGLNSNGDPELLLMLR